MSVEFPLLCDKSYVSFIQRLDGLGANQTTHIAEIRYPVQTAPIMSVVKLMHPNCLNASNEAIAWLFLRAAGFAAPKNAAMIALTEKKAVSVLGRKAIYPGLIDNGYVIAWASEKLDFKSIKAYFTGSRADQEWAQLLNTMQGAQIAAFDEVFLNADRNTGNVLYAGRNSCIPIDHEHIFDHQDWIGGDIVSVDRDSDSMRVLKRAYQSGALNIKTFDETKNKMVHYAQQHASALAACKVEITNLIAKLFGTNSSILEERVLRFATERTAMHWMEDRLGVM